MINAGAIVVSSLLKKDLNVADRFDYVSQKVFVFSFDVQYTWHIRNYFIEVGIHIFLLFQTKI